MDIRTNKYLITALLIGIAFHGTSIFFTIEYTYDALIHLFFAEHYASSWFDPWSYKWYTGFTVMGYPPLVHQAIGLFSYIGGLKFGLFSVGFIGIILFVTGAYRFSLTVTGHRNTAGYAAIMAVFSSSFLETLHIFGQLPSIVGVSILMHSMPEIYLWIKTGRKWYLMTSLSLLSVTVTSHHVTPIFGMVFFIFPLIGMVIMDASREKVGSYKAVTFPVFFKVFLKLFWRIVFFGMGSLFLIVICILPYWINTKNNPITQVPIPHGSRDNFLEVLSSGLVFFMIPWGVLLLIFPFLFYRFFSKRYLFYGLSFTMLSILGTGGTTPIPKMILGDNAFNILTLDRFTLWGSIMALPMFGEFAYRFSEKDLKEWLQKYFSALTHRIKGAFFVLCMLFMIIFTMSLGYFRPTQPQQINMLPIINFLSQDQHDHWRFLPLGFGDQMAWLSAQTKAMTVDGNYHSARRLPELTTRAVERLENSKYRGVEGLGSLQQFLTVPEKYNLKYVFSNDKFYDPLLYFCGWQRLQQLENGIMVWEKLNIPPLSSILAKDKVPLFQRLMWGIIPVTTVLVAFFLNIQMIWFRTLKLGSKKRPEYIRFKTKYKELKKSLMVISYIWITGVFVFIGYGMYLFYIQNETQLSPKNVITSYYDALDFKEFIRAHSYLDADEGKTLDQYMIEIAVTDGLLSSYAKMDQIDVEIIKATDSTAKVKATTYWVTPLEKVTKVFVHDVCKKSNKWYIKPSGLDQDIPPDQLHTQQVTDFYNHGRRRITSEQTHHEDVLKQPVLEVLKAKIVQNDTVYTVIGELQNVDEVPADVVVSATLYNDLDVELAKYSAKDQIKHKLMPKEITSFKINFESIAWLSLEDEFPHTFDPETFTPIEFDDCPTKLNLQCAGNVANRDLYKSVALYDLKVKAASLQGILFNTGIQEVTIPQILISFYNNKKELIWVDNVFVGEGVRQQRKQFFEYKFQDLEHIQVLSDDMENVFVNGLPNEHISEKVVPDRNYEHPMEQLIAVSGKGFDYVKIEINSYVGAPK